MCIASTVSAPPRRENLTAYDAWYVALAETLNTSLVTADERLAHAPGPRCPVVTVQAWNRSRGPR